MTLDECKKMAKELLRDLPLDKLKDIPINPERYYSLAREDLRIILDMAKDEKV